MKKLILTFIVCIFCKSLIFGTSPNVFQTSNDSLQSQQTLLFKRGKVFKGTYLLNKFEVLDLMKPYPEISAKYQKGQKLRNTSTLLIMGSIVSIGTGLALAIDGAQMDSDEDWDVSPDPNYYIGLAVIIVGDFMLYGGIACSIVGKVQMKRSVNSYNNQINSALMPKPDRLNYQLGLLDNGNIGFRLVF